MKKDVYRVTFAGPGNGRLRVDVYGSIDVYVNVESEHRSCAGEELHLVSDFENFFRESARLNGPGPVWPNR